jgi:hypothetical protein
MTHLWLNGNSLLETISSELGNLAKLETLSRVGNFLTRAMPTEICSLRRPFGRLATLEVDAVVAPVMGNAAHAAAVVELARTRI